MVSLAFGLKISTNSKFENEQNLVDFSTVNLKKLSVWKKKKQKN